MTCVCCAAPWLDTLMNWGRNRTEGQKQNLSFYEHHASWLNTWRNYNCQNPEARTEGQIAEKAKQSKILLKIKDGKYGF